MKKEKTQREKFIAAARAAGCDESDGAFDAKLKALVTVKPMTNAQIKNRAKKHGNQQWRGNYITATILRFSAEK